MKKLIVGIVALLSVGSLWAAVTQPQFIGTVMAVLESKTAAQTNAYTPKRTGQLLYCSDCTLVRICTSSGTVVGSWVVAVATGVFTAASYPHCQ